MKILVYSLILLVSLSSMDIAFSLFSFKYYQKNITKTICINKDKPQLKCNGKCALSKVLKKRQQDEQKNTDLNLVEKQMIYSNSLFFPFFLKTSILKSKPFKNIEFLILTLPVIIFHPPD